PGEDVGETIEIVLADLLEIVAKDRTRAQCLLLLELLDEVRIERNTRRTTREELVYQPDIHAWGTQLGKARPLPQRQRDRERAKARICRIEGELQLRKREFRIDEGDDIA